MSFCLWYLISTNKRPLTGKVRHQLRALHSQDSGKLCSVMFENSDIKEWFERETAPVLRQKKIFEKNNRVMFCVMFEGNERCFLRNMIRIWKDFAGKWKTVRRP